MITILIVRDYAAVTANPNSRTRVLASPRLITITIKVNWRFGTQEKGEMGSIPIMMFLSHMHFSRI